MKFFPKLKESYFSEVVHAFFADFKVIYLYIKNEWKKR